MSCGGAGLQCPRLGGHRSWSLRWEAHRPPWSAAGSESQLAWWHLEGTVASPWWAAELCHYLFMHSWQHQTSGHALMERFRQGAGCGVTTALVGSSSSDSHVVSVPKVLQIQAPAHAGASLEWQMRCSASSPACKSHPETLPKGSPRAQEQ